ncbi:hypothetical protein [Algoriphagus litoralis]|uniref:hypothetical protein n=1 Tax=Algoriphagus litoralis TaxID=2202829 RepID=UPI001E41C879|nr:hypothetical protein [Algoriphagus litoralis]
MLKLALQGKSPTMVPAGDLAGLAWRMAKDVAPVGAYIGNAGQQPIGISEQHGFLQAKLQKRKRIYLLREGHSAAVAGKLPGFGKDLLNQLIIHFMRAVKRRRQSLRLRNVRMDLDGFQIYFYLDALLNYSF